MIQRRRTALAALLAFFISLMSRDLHAQAATVTTAEVDGLIEKLGDVAVKVRETADSTLFAKASASLANALLIKGRLRDVGEKSGDAEIMSRSGRLLDKLVSLGLLTITIDDATETVKATSDGDDANKVIIDNLPGKVETVLLRDKFFRDFVGPTKLVYFIEYGTVPDKSGLVQLSDQIFFGDLGDGTNGLTFESDADDKPLGRGDCTADDVVCLQEGFRVDVAKLIFGARAGFMTIMVTSDAPEPATVTLFGTGIAALAGCASRRRRPARSKISK